MFVKAIKIAKSAMFPVFRCEQVVPQQINLLTTGAGFFVNSEGYFITVAHIFDNPNQNTTFLYYGLLPDQIHNPPLIIKEISKEDDLDVFLGKIDVQTPNYFTISRNSPEIGRSVCLSGYPLAQITRNAQGGPELGGVRRYFQPSFVLDYISMNCDNGFGRIRMHNGFLVRDLGLFGMSGGPVFDIDGQVLGMQGSVTQPRISQGSGRTISVENAVAIKAEFIINILSKNNLI